MCVAQMMVILDATIVNIALPNAQKSLHFDAADRQWVITAYALAFGGLLLIGGRLADYVGRRSAVLLGLVGFGFASALGGAATNFTMLVIARGVQGAFGALLAPATLAVITTTFTGERERGKAFGIYGSVSAGGAAVGLLLGGVLTEYATWRWTLYVNVALAIVGSVGTLLLLDRQRTPAPQRLDIVGTTLITGGLFGLVFGFANADRHGWADGVTLTFLVAGAALTVAFVAVESWVRNPILPLRVIASRTRGAALLALFLGSVGLFAEFLFLTYYLQQTLGYSPIQAGLAFLPQTAGTVVAASIGSGYLLVRLSGRVLIPAGMLLAAGGMALLALIGPHGHYASTILPGVILIGSGLGLALATAINLGIMGVAPEDAGVASAAVNAVQQIGASIGPSLFNTIAGSVVASYLVRHAGQRSADSLANAHSYSVSFAIAAAVFLGASVLCALLLPSAGKRPAGKGARGALGNLEDASR